ncbi:MAG TPA: RMD1 family protein [Gammaproteobacteria bacterium]|nr:RMD1 family protein [Gammaproteobacteria bacterium]
MLEVPKSFSRCVSYCTANSYNLAGLANFFKKKGYSVRSSRDYVQVTRVERKTDIVFFSHGCLVSWGLTKSQEQKILEQILPFSNFPLEKIESDFFCYVIGEETSIDTDDKLRLDVITLDTDNSLVKLAFSYALAQSTKLENFEESIQDAIRKNGSLPEEIANRGVISLSRRAIFKRIGEIFLVRSSINLNSEFLDAPEFFWRNPNLEPMFISAKKFLDIPTRLMALNQKLDVLQELLHILNGQLQHSHSNLLETIIILLILIEIMISLFKFHLW